VRVPIHSIRFDSIDAYLKIHTTTGKAKMLALAALLPTGSGERLSILKGVARWEAEETGQGVPELELLLALAGAYREVSLCRS
jgi:hypothetical protein